MKKFNVLSKARWLLLMTLAIVVTRYAVADVTCTLSNANIIAGTTAADGYGNKSVTDGCSHTWTAYAIKKYHSNSTTDHEFLQIRGKNGNTLYWIAVPEYSGYTIKSITARVSGTSTTYNGGGNSATLYFSSSNSSATASSGLSANPKTAVSGTGASSITLDCESLGLASGYITASGGIRLWGDIVVTYKPSCTSLASINGSFF